MTLHDIPSTTETDDALMPRVERPTTQRSVRAWSVLTARVLSGLFAGFFLTYSMSVVVGLARVDDLTYVTTFQSINATIRNPTFAIVFFGTLPAVLAAAALDRTQRRMLGVGAALLFVSIAITFVWNVPLNEQLATYVDVTPASAAQARDEFEDSWNRWNLLRTIASVAGAICVCAAGTRRHAPAA